MDNTAANGVRVTCRGPGVTGTHTHQIHDNPLNYGTWGSWSAGCPSGQAVCSLLTRVEQDPGQTSWGVDIDSVSLTDAQMRCCYY